MKNVSWNWLAFIGLVVLLFVTGNASVSLGGVNAETGAPVVVEAPPADAEPGPVDDAVNGLAGTMPQLLTAGAIGGLFAFIMNLGKLIPKLGEWLNGKSASIVYIINVVVLVAVTIGGLFGFGDRVKDILEQAGNTLPAVMGLITVVGGLVSSVGGSALVHKIMKTLNATAFSMTARAGAGG